MEIKELGITVVEKPLKKKLGYYDTRTATIVIDSNQSKAGKEEIFIHEVIHAIETQLILTGMWKTKIEHGVVKTLAANLLMMFVLAGKWKGCSKQDFLEFCKNEKEAEHEARSSLS